MQDIIKPTLLINEAICKRNIATMAEKARSNNVDFRPHFKTHQSHEIGRWFREFGVDKITVSSLDMATYFEADGWNDITVAFPTNVLEYRTINTLASKIKLNLLFESEESVNWLEPKLTAKINVFIKIDTGYGRTGIHYKSLSIINDLISKLMESNYMNFEGFLIHAGQSYHCRSKEEILEVHEDTIQKITWLKEQYQTQIPNLKISIGDTPTCSVARDFRPANEIRPGNFVFYDLTQHYIGSSDINQIGVAMACPVVAKHQDRNEIIVYGGGVHFSKDRFVDHDGKTVYGQLVTTSDKVWGAPIKGVYMTKLSQEHGTLSVTADWMEKLKIGDIVKILPVHSCMTADLMKGYVNVVDGKVIEMMR